MATRRDPSWRWLQPICVRVTLPGWSDRIRPVVAVEDCPAEGAWALRLVVINDRGQLVALREAEYEVAQDAVGAWPAVVQLMRQAAGIAVPGVRGDSGGVQGRW